MKEDANTRKMSRGKETGAAAENIAAEDSVAEADRRFMKEAVRLARKAEKNGDVPIGCVIVRDGEILARGYNRRNRDHSTLAHAEILAIRRASRKIGDWRLEDCTLYVTLEPCPMCAGAILQARIPTVVFGCRNPRAGSAGSVLNLLRYEGFHQDTEIREGILREECSALLTGFFSNLRKARKKQTEAEKKQTQV